MSYKPLTDHQKTNLWYIYEDAAKSKNVYLERLNMSVLRSLIRRGLVNIVPTNEGFAEGERIMGEWETARIAEDSVAKS